jgi:hypothetical protein
LIVGSGGGGKESGRQPIVGWTCGGSGGAVAGCHGGKKSGGHTATSTAEHEARIQLVVLVSAGRVWTYVNVTFFTNVTRER